MHTEVKLHHLNPERLLSEYVERRLSFTLGRFGNRIGRVTVRITSTPVGASDEFLCRMAADLHAFGTISAEATDPDVYSAIDRCAGRLARQCESKCARPRSARASRMSIRVPGSILAA
jgi:ribosomal subunit interface protein